MPEPEPHEPAGLTGNAPADLQAETARLAGQWGLGKLNEISDEQARDDLGRLSSQMMGIVARSARLADGATAAIPDDVVRRGSTAPRGSSSSGEGEADLGAKAIDTYWICTAEHGLNASTFTARVTASTGADWRRSPRQSAPFPGRCGGAPAYVKPMLEEVAAMGDPEKWVSDSLDSGKRIMGFGHRCIAPDRSRILKETARELGSLQIEVAEQLEEAALAELERRHPEHVLKTNVEYYSALVLDVAEILRRWRLRCSPARVWPAGRLSHPRAEANRASVSTVCAVRRAQPARRLRARDARRGGCRGGRSRAGR